MFFKKRRKDENGSEIEQMTDSHIEQDTEHGVEEKKTLLKKLENKFGRRNLVLIGICCCVVAFAMVFATVLQTGNPDKPGKPGLQPFFMMSQGETGTQGTFPPPGAGIRQPQLPSLQLPSRTPGQSSPPEPDSLNPPSPVSPRPLSLSQAGNALNLASQGQQQPQQQQSAVIGQPGVTELPDRQVPQAQEKVQEKQSEKTGSILNENEIVSSIDRHTSKLFHLKQRQEELRMELAVIMLEQQLKKAREGLLFDSEKDSQKQSPHQQQQVFFGSGNEETQKSQQNISQVLEEILGKTTGNRQNQKQQEDLFLQQQMEMGNEFARFVSDQVNNGFLRVKGIVADSVIVEWEGEQVGLRTGEFYRGIKVKSVRPNCAVIERDRKETEICM